MSCLVVYHAQEEADVSYFGGAVAKETPPHNGVTASRGAAQRGLQAAWHNTCTSLYDHVGHRPAW